MSRTEFLFRVLVGFGIVFIGVGSYFGALLPRFPKFRTDGELIGFYGSLAILLFLILGMLGLSSLQEVGMKWDIQAFLASLPFVVAVLSLIIFMAYIGYNELKEPPKRKA